MQNLGRILASTLVVTLSGCAYLGDQVEVQRAELAALEKKKVPTDRVFFDLTKYDGLIAYGQVLSDTYLDLSAKAARGQDLAALGIIVAAATTAGGLLFGGGGDLTKGAGLAAGTIVAGQNYLKPGEASAALLVASEQAHCIVRAAHTHTGASFDTDVAIFKSTFSNLGGETQIFANLSRPNKFFRPHGQRNMTAENARAFVAAISLQGKAKSAKDTRVEIIRDGLRTVRISLRKTLKRDLPDYGTLVENIRAAIIKELETEQEQDDLPGESTDGTAGLLDAEERLNVQIAGEIASAIDKLRTEVGTCVVSA